MPLACVLDLDETLGYFDGRVFQVRPRLQLFLNFLRFCKARTYVWSLGTDEYLKRMVNGYLPDVQKFVYKIYGRSECEKSLRLYGVYKSSVHIRDECEEHLIVMCVDDKVQENMDEGYDLRISIPPYSEVDPNDVCFVDAIDEILNFLMIHKIHIDYDSQIKTSFDDEYDQ